MNARVLILTAGFGEGHNAAARALALACDAAHGPGTARVADVFALASRFEGYGMAFAEAIAHGVPVVGTNAGAIPGTVPPDAGLLVAPDDATAFASALRRLISNSDERRRYAYAARSAAGQLPTWPESAKLFAGALEAVT